MREMPMCKAEGCTNRCKTAHTRRKGPQGWARVATRYCSRECSDVAVGLTRADRNRSLRFRQHMARLGRRFTQGDLLVVMHELLRVERNSAYSVGRRRGIKLGLKMAQERAA
jgi:hypothetical protein